MKLIAVQTFTDRQGNERQQNEQFDVRDEQEAQQYIRSGQAKQAESK